MVQLHVERTIAAPQDRVFDWLADPASLTAAPLVLKATWEGGAAAPRAGAVRTVLGLGMWFREEITAYQPPHEYSYLILKSFPAFEHDGGTLTFTPIGDQTRVDWVTSYTHPRWTGGKAFEKVSTPLLRMSFEAVLEGCATATSRR